MAKGKLVSLVLSNPLDADQAAGVRAEEVRDYQPGDTIKVPPTDAQAIVAAGYAHKVDPNVPEQVAKALHIPVAEAKAAIQANAATRAAAKSG